MKRLFWALKLAFWMVSFLAWLYVGFWLLLTAIVVRHLTALPLPTSAGWVLAAVVLGVRRPHQYQNDTKG